MRFGQKHLISFYIIAVFLCSTTAVFTEELDFDTALENLPGAGGNPDSSIASAGLPGGATARLIDTSLIGNFNWGASNVRADQLTALQGHLHDPRMKGFSLTALELSFSGAVDPYFTAQTHINLSHGAEIEEAFITSQALPWNLQLRAGQYFTEFGLVNPTHPHTWYFMDAPVIMSRVMGNHGMTSPGVRLAWLAPVPWFSEILLSVQNASGEYMQSFIGSAGGGGHDHGHSHGGGDMPIGGYELMQREESETGLNAVMLRWENSFDVTESLTAQLGLSAMTGPNATGPQGLTNIYGADIYFKWRPSNSFRGFPFVVFQTEFMRREYRVHKMPDSGDLGRTWMLLSGDYFDPYNEREVFTDVVLQELFATSVLSPDQGDFGLAAQILNGSIDPATLSQERLNQAIEATKRVVSPFETLHDYGFYSQLIFGFTRGWSVGVRYEFASGTGESWVDGGDYINNKDPYGRDRDPNRDTRFRYSGVLIYQPTHFSRFRLQYNQEKADHLRENKIYRINLQQLNPSLPSVPYDVTLSRKSSSAWSVWVGAEFLIGEHPAHEF